MGFPLDPETITPLTDGVDYEEASNINTLITKLANIVSFLGVAGNTQAKLAALNRIWKYMLKPLPAIAWIDNDTIEIAPCVMLMHDGNNYVIKENISALQIQLSVDLDTGSEAANTWYDVFLIGDGSNSQYTAKFVVQGNTPSGATYYKKIFAVLNDASSNILKFFHRGKRVMWDVPINVTTSVSAGAWSSALSCAAAMPAISKMGIFGLNSFKSDAGCGVLIRANGSTWSTNYANGAYGTSAHTAVGVTGQRECPTDDSQQIQYYNDTGDTSTRIDVEGYELTELT